MAYRRRQGISRSSTFKEEFHPSLDDDVKYSSDHYNASPSIFSSSSASSSSASSSSLAAQAIKASAFRRQPSLSFAFEPKDHSRSKSFEAYGNGNSKSGLWGVIAQKAKSILDDDKSTPQHDIIPQPPQLKSHSFSTFTGPSPAPAQNSPLEFKPVYQSLDCNRKMDNPRFRKGLDAITSSLNQLGDTFEKAFEEGRTIVENKTADLRTQIRRKGSGEINQNSDLRNPLQEAAQTQTQSSNETKLKASRDVAMATAAKAKLLLRELKSVKADLAFAKARCAQLEAENKVLRDREGTDKGQNREDDDLIRHQMETLLAEKARLASENETYSRENRFLREVVEYHQLTMQDVVYIDEGMGEVTEVYPAADSGITRLLYVSSHSLSPPSPDEDLLASPTPPMLSKEIFTVQEEDDKSTTEDETSSTVSDSKHKK